MTDSVTTSVESGANQTPTENSTPVTPVTPDYSNIPEDVILSHPLYKSVLAESIARRKEIAELKKAVQPQQTEQTTKPADPTDPMQVALERIAKLERQLSATELLNNRQRAAQMAGLPDVFVNRIVGETFEDMLADAKAIAEALPKPAASTSVPAASNVSPGNAAGNQRDQTMLNKITQRMGTGFGVGSPFDAGVQRQVGGGIIETKE